MKNNAMSTVKKSHSIKVRVLAMLACAAGGVLGSATTSQAEIDAYWLHSITPYWTTDYWNNSANWMLSTTGPNSGYPSGSDYNVIIDASGGGYNYNVFLNSNITINSLTIDSSEAYIGTSSSSYSLTVNQGIYLNSGSLGLAGIVNTPFINGWGTITGPTYPDNLINLPTLGADSHLSGSGYLSLAKDLTFANGGEFFLGKGVNSVTMNFADSNASIKGDGTLWLMATDSATVRGSGTLTLQAGTTIKANGGSISAVNFINNGTMIIDRKFRLQAPGSASVGGTSFTNNGTIQVMSGSQLSVGGNYWTNNGSIIADNAVLYVGGTYLPTVLDNIHASGGKVYLNGSLDNAGQTLNLASSRGAYSLSGTIKGGIIASTDGSILNVNGGTLDGVTLGDGGITTVARVGSDLSAPKGIQFNKGTVKLIGSNSVFRLDGDLTGDGSVLIGTDSYALMKMLSPSGSAINIGSQVKVGFDTTSGSNYRPFAWVGDGTTAINNQGVISSEVPYTFMQINGTTVSNTGTIKVSNRGYLRVSGQLTDFGTMIVDGGTLELANTNFTPDMLTRIQRVGGVVALAGTYDNTGKTLALDDATGSLSMIEMGKIIGGTVSTTAGSALHAQDGLNQSTSGTLDGVTISGAGGLVVEDGAQVIILNNLTLQNSDITFGTSIIPPYSVPSKSITFVNGGSLLGTGTVRFEKGSSGGGVINTNGQNMALTIGQGITIETGTAGGEIGQTAGLVTNKGTIKSWKSGQAIYLTPNTFINEGEISAYSGGKIQILGLKNKGTILVSDTSTLDLRNSASNDGLLHLYNRVTLMGDFIQSEQGTLQLFVPYQSSTTPLLSITSNGSAYLGGTLSIEMPYTPSLWSQWTLLKATSINGEFDTLVLPSLINGRSLEVSYLTDRVLLTVVPEPATVGLAGMGLMGLLLRRRQSTR